MLRKFEDKPDLGRKFLLFSYNLQSIGICQAAYPQYAKFWYSLVLRESRLLGEKSWPEKLCSLQLYACDLLFLAQVWVKSRNLLHPPLYGPRTSVFRSHHFLSSTSCHGLGIPMGVDQREPSAWLGLAG